MNFTIEKKEWKKMMVFLTLFFINIGFKEIFRFFAVVDFVIEAVLILTLVSFVILLNNKINSSHLLIVSIIFYLNLVVMSFGSSDTEYGLQKAFLGLLMPLVLYNFFCRSKWNEEQIIKYMCFAVLIISIIGILSKLRGGFFDRSVSFGLLGAIPFGWLNGMAFLSLVLQKKKKPIQILFALFFFLMVIWTGSKGPLVGIVVVCIIFFNRIMGKKFSTKILVILFVALLIYILSIFKDDIRSIRSIIDFLSDPEEYSEGVGKGSIGSRSQFMDISLTLFDRNPIAGVGFGGWQNSNFTSEHKYPHNVFFELLSETGIIGMFLFLLLIFTLKFKTTLGYIGMFGLITLCFSGDFSYFRYAFFPILLSTYLLKNEIIYSSRRSI